jgi:hypothetical protein
MKRLIPLWLVLIVIVAFVVTALIGGYMVGIWRTWPIAETQTVSKIKAEIIDEITEGPGFFKIKGMEGIEFYPRLSDRKKVQELGCRMATASYEGPSRVGND